MADPQRTALTATAVMALLALPTACSSRSGSTASTLLLAATAQGVLTVWDLSDLRPASFGSIQPEPRCLKRIEYTAALLCYDPVTLIGAAIPGPAHCRLCADRRVPSEGSAADGGSTYDDECRVPSVQVLSTEATSFSSSQPPYVASSTPAAAAAQAVLGSVLLTLSTGSVHMADLNACIITSSTAHSYSTTYQSGSGGSKAVGGGRVLQAVHNPLAPAVLSYEQLRRELAAAAEQGPGADTGTAEYGMVWYCMAPL